jgi:hypothetical protein
MIISMKTINPNCWALYEEWGAPVPITAPPVANINNLYYSFYLYNSRGLAIFYYRLSGIVLYILYKDDYFDEED